MKKISVFVQVLNRLYFMRNRDRPNPSATGPMSDRELGLAIRGLKCRTAALRAERMRASAEAELRQLRHSLNEEDACAAERARQLVGETIKLLHDPLPDTFLGRRTQEPFSSEDKG
jgi:hypothetical protein